MMGIVIPIALFLMAMACGLTGHGIESAIFLSSGGIVVAIFAAKAKEQS